MCEWGWSGVCVCVGGGGGKYCDLNDLFITILEKKCCLVLLCEKKSFTERAI